MESGSVTLLHVEFLENASVSGGAVSSRDAVISVDNSQFIGNFTYYEGGALYLKGSQVEMKRTLFLGNAVNSNGGAICSIGTSLDMRNVMLIENAAGYEGGALHLNDDYGVLGEVLVLNTTFRSNHASSVGGAISNMGNVPASMSNVVMVENVAGDCGGIEGNMDTLAGHCDLWGNVPNEQCGWFFYHGGPDGNVILPPEFVDTAGADPASWDLHLDVTSPLIDAGDPTLLGSGRLDLRHGRLRRPRGGRLGPGRRRVPLLVAARSLRPRSVPRPRP